MESLNSVQALCMSAGVGAYVSAEPSGDAGPMGGSFARRVGESGWEGEGLLTGDFTPSSILVAE
jgi:hypothetical protein